MTEYFGLDTKKASGEPAVVDAALRRAWNACAGMACSKCGVPAWQYCRNSTRGTLLVTRFHRPRQEAAGALKILAKVGIRELSWAKVRAGGIKWDDRRVPTL
ncbi:hypothetical protein [Amycolatopsis sp. NPDC059657]|uniref:zinc finger domain-containing protein n=1 Tax=Amycolatopsis sp. NPDC059657 TaxID=3346899 RepID=UPI00367065AC